MAVKASASISIWDVVDIESVTWYYKLQSSTAAAPSKPTTATPSGWTTTEPTYTAGSTNTLYITCKVLFSDGTFAYSDVSKSSSYEAAKEAYNKAQNAQDTANGTKQYFWHDSAGAHVSTNPNSATSGKNLLLKTDGIAIKDGNKELATFEDSEIYLGKNSHTSKIDFCNGAGYVQGSESETGLHIAIGSNGGPNSEGISNGGMSIAMAKYGLITAENLTIEVTSLDINSDVPIRINGQPLADYVVEQGTSGIWTYRKWASGIAECWCNYALTVSYIYGNYVNGSIAFPFTFVGQEPNATVSFGVESVVSAYCAYSGTSTTQINVYGYVPNNNAGRKCWFHINAVGRWK